VAFAQTPTPPPVDSNIAVTVYAQSRGFNAFPFSPTPAGTCTTRGGNGCGGCYPASIPGSDPTSELPKVDPEWSGIGTMIPIIQGGDATLPPLSSPVLLKGTVALTKINVGGDFPGSHITDDQNTFITPDPDFNGFLATGNSGVTSCPGEGCDKVEMELEIGKYPLFAWAGEGDHVTALGRWIFDCGHPDPNPGACSNDNSKTCISDSDCGTGNTCVGGVGTCTTGSTRCIIDADCTGKCNLPPGTCANNASHSCTVNGDCNFGTCSTPPTFNYRAEMHPPQAIAVVRNKSVKKIPATQADVYISSDAGGAGDLCTVTHLASAGDVLFGKVCFKNHCSVTTSRSCNTNKDCASGEKCIIFDSTLDTSKLVADVNGQNFEFDMPLPLPMPSPATLKITTKSFKPAGGVMPKATFQPTLGPTPNLHVVIPMAAPLPSGKLPNVFAQRISARWKEDTTALTHVQVKFTKLTVNNPLKDRVSAIPRQCVLASGGLSNNACVTDADCLPGTCALANPTKACHTDKDCAKKDSCANAARCVGGVTPGWDVFGQVNGDWVRFTKLETIGAKAPFLAPPYTKPSPTPLIIPEKFTLNEYVPSTGTIHIATTGHSLNCLDTLYGGNLKVALSKFGLSLGGACLAAGDTDPGRIDITHTGPGFTDAPDGVTCTSPTPPKVGPTVCDVTSDGGDGGTCSITTNKLCTTDADCPGTCSGSGVPVGLCETAADCKHCSITTSKFCASDFDCPAGTCDNNANKACHANADCGGVHTCTTPGTPETCVASVGASCDNVETCSGTGGAFTLEYTIQVK
jgi:hypothetical protein